MSAPPLAHDGEIEKFKRRVVAQVYSQREGIDKNETFFNDSAVRKSPNPLPRSGCLLGNGSATIGRHHGFSMCHVQSVMMVGKVVVSLNRL